MLITFVAGCSLQIRPYEYTKLGNLFDMRPVTLRTLDLGLRAYILLFGESLSAGFH